MLLPFLQKVNNLQNVILLSIVMEKTIINQTCNMIMLQRHKESSFDGPLNKFPHLLFFLNNYDQVFCANNI
jgi:hypothetical protein